MKVVQGLLSRLKGIFTNNNEIDDDEEDNNNSIKSNIISTDRKTKARKHKKNSEKKSKPVHTNNKAIEYQNKKKKRKKVKPTTGNKYDGDSDDKEEEMYRIITKYPTVPLRVQGGDGILQVETVIEENFEEIADTDEKVMIEGEQKEEDVEKDQLGNNKNGLDNDESRDKKNRDVQTTNNNEYSKQEIFEKYTNYGYTCSILSSTCNRNGDVGCLVIILYRSSSFSSLSPSYSSLLVSFSSHSVVRILFVLVRSCGC